MTNDDDRAARLAACAVFLGGAFAAWCGSIVAVLHWYTSAAFPLMPVNAIVCIPAFIYGSAYSFKKMMAS